MIELFDLMLQLLYLCIITKSRTDRCLDLKITLNVIGKIADIAGNDHKHAHDQQRYGDGNHGRDRQRDMPDQIQPCSSQVRWQILQSFFHSVNHQPLFHTFIGVFLDYSIDSFS